MRYPPGGSRGRFRSSSFTLLLRRWGARPPRRIESQQSLLDRLGQPSDIRLDLEARNRSFRPERNDEPPGTVEKKTQVLMLLRQRLAEARLHHHGRVPSS